MVQLFGHGIRNNLSCQCLKWNVLFVLLKSSIELWCSITDAGHENICGHRRWCSIGSEIEAWHLSAGPRLGRSFETVLQPCEASILSLYRPIYGTCWHYRSSRWRKWSGYWTDSSSRAYAAAVGESDGHVASGELAEMFSQRVISEVQTFHILKLSSLEMNKMKFVTSGGLNVAVQFVLVNFIFVRWFQILTWGPSIIILILIN